jgi:hypothetical protein
VLSVPVGCFQAAETAQLKAVPEHLLICVIRFLNRNQISRGAARKLETSFGSV